MQDSIEKFGPLLGRILIALIFLLSGFGKITGFAGTAGYMASKGNTDDRTVAHYHHRDRTRRRAHDHRRLQGPAGGAGAVFCG